MESSGWSCSACGRRFTRKNQRHACGTGNADVVRDRPPELARLYHALAAFVRTLGPVALVSRERYVLVRSTRIFADLVVMTDALRLAIHLGRRVNSPRFEKVAADRRQVTHVAKLRTPAELAEMQPLLREAYTWSLAPKSERAPK